MRYLNLHAYNTGSIMEAILFSMPLRAPLRPDQARPRRPKVVTWLAKQTFPWLLRRGVVAAAKSRPQDIVV